MELNDDIVFTILDFLRVTNSSEWLEFNLIEFPEGYSEQQIDFHLKHCRDNGFVDCKFSTDGTRARCYITVEGLRHLLTMDNMTTRSETSKTVANSVFQNNQFVLNERLVFMLSPYGDPFDTIYSNHIKPTVEKINDLTCVRADNIYDNRPVIDDIWRLTNEARIIIAELTDKNPNVFYETGLAHAIDKEVILITQSSDDVPFDLRHRRYISYQETHEGIEKLKVDLTNTITNILSRTNEGSVAERTAQLVAERLAEEVPDLPPHGITGEICRKSGLYRVQNGGLYLIQKTFEEGDVFPSAATRFGEVGGFPLGMNEEKVTWVYQPPEHDEHES